MSTLVQPEREWVMYELPWGEVEVAAFADDLDRVLIRWVDVLAAYRPKLATMAGGRDQYTFVVWSWMNERVMFLMADVGDGTAMAWSYCGQCGFGMLRCSCAEGLHETPSVRWARKRALEGWLPPATAKVRAIEAAVSAAEPVEKAAPRSKGTRGTKKAATGGTGRAQPTVAETGGGSADADESMTLDQVEQASGDEAAKIIAEAEASYGKPRKRVAKKTTTTRAVKSVPPGRTGTTKRTTAAKKTTRRRGTT